MKVQLLTAKVHCFHNAGLMLLKTWIICIVILEVPNFNNIHFPIMTLVALQYKVLPPQFIY